MLIWITLDNNQKNKDSIMKINLEMNGKKLCGPNFKVFHNDDYTDFTFAIGKNNHRDYSFAHDDFTNNFVKFRYKNRTFFFETIENVYMFDLGDDAFKIPLNEIIKATMTILDSNNELIYTSGKK